MAKKVKAAYKKTDISPNSQARALLQLRDTPIAVDLPSPAEILHGRPTQGAVMPWRHRPINIPRIHWCLLEIQNTQKNTSIEPIEPRTNEFWKWKNKLDSFHRNSTAWSWNGWLGQWEKYWNEDTLISSKAQTKKYRRNRAHLKPLCHDGSSFQDPSKAKKKNLTKSDNLESF